MRSSSKFLIILATVLFVAIATFDFSLLRGLIANIALSKVEKTTNSSINYESITLSWLGVDFKNITISPKKFPFEVSFDSLKIDCPTKIFWADYAGCQAQFLIHQGSGSFRFVNKEKLLGQIKDVQLSKFSFLFSHYIESGTLSISDINLDNNQDNKNLVAKLTLTNVVKSKSSNLAPSVTGLPIALKIDPISINNANADINIVFDSGYNQAKKLSIDNINIASDMGTVMTPSAIEITNHKLNNLTINFHPSAIGLSAIKPFAQFICPPESLSSTVPIRFGSNGSQVSCQIATN